MNLVADISEWQKSINDVYKLTSLCDGVIIKMGQTAYNECRYDPKFKTFYSQLKGKTRLEAYYFTLASNFTLVTKESDFIIQTLKNFPIDGTLWIDCESSNGAPTWNGLSKADRTKYMKALLDKLSYSGVDCGIYANTSWLNTKLDMSVLEGYKVWCAEYGTRCNYKGKIEMWQYTSKGKGDYFGVGSAYIDLSYDYRANTSIINVESKVTDVHTIHVAKVGLNLRNGIKGTKIGFIKKGESMTFDTLIPIAGIQSDGYQWFKGTKGSTTYYMQYDSSCYWLE